MIFPGGAPRGVEAILPGVERKYRTFWRRLWAGVLDGMALGALGGLLWTILPVSGFGSGIREEVLYLSPTVYSTLCHWRWGRTLGKYWTGVVVLDVSEGATLTLAQAMTREIAGWVEILRLAVGYVVPVFPLVGGVLLLIVQFWFPVEVITMLSNPKRRALHDYLAHSVVVRADFVQWESLEH